LNPITVRASSRRLLPFRGEARNCDGETSNNAGRERRADPVAEMASANFCEYIAFIKHEWKGAGAADAAEEKAREKLKKLFRDQRSADQQEQTEETENGDELGSCVRSVFR